MRLIRNDGKPEVDRWHHTLILHHRYFTCQWNIYAGMNLLGVLVLIVYKTVIRIHRGVYKIYKPSGP